MKRLVYSCLLCGALGAQASGFYFGDNGAKAMVQGGAFTAQADDLTAMQHNPAGLTQLDGFSFLADVDVIRHDVTFLRQDPGFDPANPSNLINTVKSNPAPFLLPFFAASYGFKLANRPFTVGLGLFAPPSQGKYEYPMPNYAKDDTGKYVEKANKFSPQRYALISTNIIIAYPTLSLAYAIHERFQVGISAQLTVSQFQQTQTLYGGDALGDNPMRQIMENPDYDATVSIDLPGQVGFTGILGVMARPTDWLSIGASVRPPIPFKARGKFKAELSEFFKNAGATITGDTATLNITMPLEIKVGARVKPLMGEKKDDFGINFDFVYQGWNSVDQLLLTPENVTLNQNGVSTPIAPVALKKNWVPAWSVRLGASYKIIKYLSVSAGALYETGAAPTSTYSVDWTHPARFIFTGGLTGHLGPIDLIAGAMFTPTNTTVITDSAVTRGQTNPDSAPAVVGNGIYTSGGYGLIFGVRGNFGGTKAAAAPVAPPPAPVETTPTEVAPTPAPAT
jgi:long-chain fatty acid transport protein